MLVNWNHRTRLVIRDRGSQYTRTFDDVFAAIGADVIHTPPGAPRAPAVAERWVRTVRHELLDRTLIWNRYQLRRLLDNYVKHYNANRPHQGIEQRAPTTPKPPTRSRSADRSLAPPSAADSSTNTTTRPDSTRPVPTSSQPHTPLVAAHPP
jgi:transposase InsO family protein